MFVSFILIDSYKFLFSVILKKYIDIFRYKNKQFSAKQQGLEFYVTYAKTISEQKSLFADKIKEKSLYKTAEYIKKDMDILAKLFYNQKT